VNAETLPAVNKLLERQGLAQLPTVTVSPGNACNVR
jgi:hypothetical protein